MSPDDASSLAPPVRARRVGLVGLGALVVGTLLGVLEGAIYPSEGPRFSHYAYWTLLAFVLIIGLYAFALLAEPTRPGHALLLSLAILPVCVVVQDYFSLLGQGQSPHAASWYATYFGDNLLTQRIWGLPGFYIILPAISLPVTLALIIGTPQSLTRRRPVAQSP